MIIIKSGDKQIYHPMNPGLQLINPRLTMEDNAAGSLTFKIYSDNLNYNSIKKLAPVLSVIRDDRTIFKGRVISDRKDFYNGKSIEVEGKLAFFNDSQMEPFEFQGSPEELFSLIVESHNAQVMDWQRFKVGIVTVTDPNDYIVRSSENILNSWEALKDKCFKSSLGGHIRIRYEKDGDYIDWLADYGSISKQSIEFARNMIDLSMDMDATETYTAIRPVGAEVEGVKIDIASVNDGKNYLVNEEKAAEYGIIFAPVEESTWTDVTLPENLLKKAREKLYGVFSTLRETYEIRAVDLHLTDESIEALNICEYVPVVSRPHGINGNYLLSKAEIHITAPQNSMFYLGSSKRVLGDVNGGSIVQPASIPKNISTFKNDAGYISVKETQEMLSGYANTEDVQEMLNSAMEGVKAGENGLSAYEVAQKNGFDGTEEEWLESLKGADGYAPKKGIDYFDGQDGNPGKDGATPTIGENGNWFINGVDTGKPSRGEAGSKGEDGQPGKDGSPGIDGKDGVTDYNDLSNKPAIPSKTSELTNDMGYVNTGNTIYTFNRNRNPDGTYSDDISTELRNIGMSLDLSFQENMNLLKKINIRGTTASLFITLNSNPSVFNEELPSRDGGILTVEHPKGKRRIFIFDDYRAGKRYINFDLDGTYDTWRMINPTPINNLLATVAGTALDAVQGKVLDEKIGLLSSLTTSVKTSIVAAINNLNAKLDFYNVMPAIETNFSNLKEFVSATNSGGNANPKIIRIKDTGGWGPDKVINAWYRAIVMYQNSYREGLSYDVQGSVLLFGGVNVYGAYIGTITGNYDNDNLAITYKKIQTVDC